MDTNEAATAVAQENEEVKEQAAQAVEETAKAVTGAVETAAENKDAVQAAADAVQETAKNVTDAVETAAENQGAVRNAAEAVEESARKNAGATAVAGENKSSMKKREPRIPDSKEESMKDYMDVIDKKRPVKDDTKQIAWDKMKAAMDAHEVVEAQITEVVKAGVLCHPEGLRAFIPASKLSLSFVDDKDLPSYVGKTVKTHVITCDAEENKLVLSVRDVLRAAQDKERAERIAQVRAGSIMEGKVESLTDFGAFVDLGEGVTGLVHISRISHNHIKHPKDVLKEGETVRVKVVQVKDGKVSLSMKDLEEAPAKDEPDEKFKYKSEGEATTSLADLIKKAGF
ncbi:MAG: S1 RNA-binding domain-containing protein [Lachnospiraceae bacterium]|nr:S1 RNA-binding domain-containing protein [Lachnospiraceae bacterium]